MRYRGELIFYEFVQIFDKFIEFHQFSCIYFPYARVKTRIRTSSHKSSFIFMCSLCLMFGNAVKLLCFHMYAMRRMRFVRINANFYGFFRARQYINSSSARNDIILSELMLALSNSCKK